jgi:arylsulfatase A-like enzyme
LAQNADLAPTFTELASAPPPGLPDGRSLAGLLHGQTPSDWRQAALVEHHGPNTRGGDPDRQGEPSGNPPSYTALRTATGSYVEYATGEREYYDLRNDPHQLTNTYPALSAAEQARLHEVATALARCRGSDCHPTIHP